MEESMKRLLFSMVLVLVFAAPLSAEEKESSGPAMTAAQATYADIEKTLSVVPTFFKRFPAESIPGAWEEFKSIQLNPSTELSGKYKELIGLAVAAQIPCQYCVFFHTEAARLNGATDEEVSEAIAMSALTRHWSTVLNGSMVPESEFRKQAAEIFAYVKNPTKAAMAPKAVSDSDSAWKDIEATFGIVPSFFRAFPSSGISGAWKEMKALQLNPNTAIPGRYKELIGLAVAAQIPCHYCTYFHTEAAKMNGATEEQVKEAIAMSAITRHWSTVLNGIQIDPAAFHKEADQIFAAARKMKKP
jgi:AhpD family alkylhydroperoxidase